MKIINKDDSNDNDGSGSNNDNDVKHCSGNYGDSYSNHYEICDHEDDNDDDNSDNYQIMNARITLHIGRNIFKFKMFRFKHLGFTLQSFSKLLFLTGKK